VIEENKIDSNKETESSQVDDNLQQNPVENKEHTTERGPLDKELIEEKESSQVVDQSKETPKKNVSKEKEEEELPLINLKDLKNKVIGFFKGSKENQKKAEHTSKNKKSEEKEEDISFDIKKVTSFAKNNAKWLIPLACILIAMFVSIFLRSMPSSLPVTDNWAEDTVQNFYLNQVSSQINQQYPNLPAQNKNILIEKEFKAILKQNKEQIQANIDQLSAEYKSFLQDEEGQTYLLAIDPYYWLRHARNYLETGQAGTTFIGGEYAVPEEVMIMYPNLDTSNVIDWEGQRMAPIGASTKMNFHSYTIAYLYKFLSLFGFSLMATAFWVPVIISSLCVIPTFFITRRFAGNIGGLFGGLLIAVHQAFVSRTAGGFSDTDAYNVIFPLLIVWTLVTALYKDNQKEKLIYSGISGLLVGIYAYVWFWWSTFDIILLGLGIYLAYLVVIHLTKKQKIKEIKETIILTLAFTISSGIFVSMFTSIGEFVSGFFEPLKVIQQLKAVAVYTLWPTIETTVAELNPSSISSTISAMGGNLIFSLAILGIVFAGIKFCKEEKYDLKFSILLLTWFVVTLYSTTKGLRFSLLLVAPFSIALGIFCGRTFQYLSKWISSGLKIEKKITQVVLVILLAFLLIQPVTAGYNQAKYEIPSMNDAWYNTLTKINQEASSDAIINSWWDFGHWFITIADRKVTFDGGGQDEHMAYWIGRSLLTNDEMHAKGIIRMIDCGNNNAFWVLDEMLDDTTRTIEILNELVLLEKNEAIEFLENEGLTKKQALSVTKYSHCNPPEDYYITSEDMVSKSGVWGHFGSWDFNRAEMYNKVADDKNNGPRILKEEFGLTEDQANEIYYQIINTPADQWISSWPTYQGSAQCQPIDENNLKCEFNINQNLVPININLKTMVATIESNNGKVYPNSLVYASESVIEEKEFEGNLLGLSLILLDNNRAMLSHPLQAKSMFTQLFFFDGLGLECFEKFDEKQQFTGGKILVWKLNWNC
jgi:dolichyl-phosphooligosaccharide-protein glycotransferase